MTQLLTVFWRQAPYKKLALDLAHKRLPPAPSVWDVSTPGWVRYSAQHPQGTKVAAPEEAALVFDVEVCMQGGNKYPTLAVCASSDAWYVVSLRRLRMEHGITI